jgi:hypothetical protein
VSVLSLCSATQTFDNSLSVTHTSIALIQRVDLAASRFDLGQPFSIRCVTGVTGPPALVGWLQLSKGVDA